eukprot:m.39610 g.39610  ORF g.39610 m.39610 type:complete len:109 (-) comp11626_c0_seq1:78-404(-)
MSAITSRSMVTDRTLIMYIWYNGTAVNQSRSDLNFRFTASNCALPCMSHQGDNSTSDECRQVLWTFRANFSDGISGKCSVNLMRSVELRRRPKAGPEGLILDLNDIHT